MNLLHTYRLWKWNRKMKNIKIISSEQAEILYGKIRAHARSYNKFGWRYFKEKDRIKRENDELRKVFENGCNLTYIK